MQYTKCKGCDTFACWETEQHVLSGFGEEEDAVAWFILHFPILCCNQPMTIQVFNHRDSTTHRRQCTACKATRGIFTGSPFEKMRTTPRAIIAAILFFCHGIPQNVISKLSNVCPETLCKINSILETLITAYNFVSYVDTCEDPCAELQADETAVGARKYNRGARRRRRCVCRNRGG